MFSLTGSVVLSSSPPCICCYGEEEVKQDLCERKEEGLWDLYDSSRFFEIIYFQLWDFSIYDIFFVVFVSLIFFDLVSSLQVSPRHSAVIITFLGGVYFIFFGLFVLFGFLNNFLTLVHICLG